MGTARVYPSSYVERAYCWMDVGCFGFNGPLRQYFSLYRAVSQREGEREEKGQMREKSPNNPHPHLLQAQQALALL